MTMYIDAMMPKWGQCLHMPGWTAYAQLQVCSVQKKGAVPLLPVLPEKEPAIEKSKTCSMSPSQLVPHAGTADTRPCLTSLFEWEAVTQGDMAACEREGCVCNFYLSFFLP